MFHRRLLPLLLTAILLLTTAVTAQDDAGPTIPATPSQVTAEPEVPELELLEEAEQKLVTDSGTFMAMGNSVLRLDPQDGTVMWRRAVSGTVTLLEEAEELVSVVTEPAAGLSERISLDGVGRASAVIRFTTDPAVLGSLRDEARGQDPEARLELDSTNPYLYLAAAADADDEELKAELLQQAVDSADTFYDHAFIAGLLADAGDFELAGSAMQLSLQDFAERGYDPGLLTDPAVHAAYGFPVPRLQEAVRSDDSDAAAFWAGWTEAFLSPNSPWVADALDDYATWLDGQGEQEAAEDWHERAQAGTADLALTGVDRLFGSIGASGWYMFASLVFTILALQVTLTFKYWEPQTLSMRRSLETGGSASFMQRLLAIRFFSTTEKLVLALLYVSGFAVLGLTAWAARPADAPAAFAAGTLASAEAQDALGRLELSGQNGEFVLGYAAQVTGDMAEAEAHYLRAGAFGPALNNLGALTGNPDLYDEAARLAPALRQPRFNQADGGESTFQRLAGLDLPVLAVPGPLDFRTALQGTWQQALTSTFMQPWTAFTIHAGWLPLQWLWYIVLGLYVLLGALTLLWILVPRPRLARNAPRSIAYHVLALLVPGSGMADELWGIMLLVPWGIVGIDAAWRLAGAGPLLALPQYALILVLAIVYAINLASFIVEFGSYRRRMRQLFRSNPEAGVAYGRRIAPSNQQS